MKDMLASVIEKKYLSHKTRKAIEKSADINS